MSDDEDFSDASHALSDQSVLDENDSKKRKRSGVAASEEIRKLREDMKAVKAKMKLLTAEVEKMSEVMERLEAQEEKLLKMETEVRTVDVVVKEVEKDVKEIGIEVKSVDSDVREVQKVVKKIDVEVKEQNTVMKKEVESYSERILNLEERSIDQEGRSRRKNVIFRGVKETENENCMNVARKLIRDECKFPEEVIIERAHRIGKSRKGMLGRKALEPRPLIVRFLSYTDRQKVRKAAKDNLREGLQCKEDLPYAVRQARQKLSTRFEAATRDANVNDVYISFPAKLYVNGELVASINPATLEPYNNRPGVQQRPHTAANQQRDTSGEAWGHNQRSRGGGQFRGNNRGRGSQGQGYGYGRRSHYGDS